MGLEALKGSRPLNGVCKFEANDVTL